VTTFATGLQAAQQLHVAPDGSDAQGDGSAAAPFASIRRAAEEAGPGTAVVVHSGTYSGGQYLADVRGTAAAPIWIGGAAGEPPPRIEGGSQALQLVRPRYLVLHDLEIRGQEQNGINCDDGGAYGDAEAARWVVFERIAVQDVGSGGNQDCLKLSGLNDFWVLDSHFARCGGGGSGSGVDCVGCHRGLIAGCRFASNAGNAIQCKGGASDIDILRNRLDDPGQRGVNMGGSTGFDFFRPPLQPDGLNAEARRIRVQANVIVGGHAAVAFVGCVDCLAAHNTIVDPEGWVLRILQETTSRDGYSFAACSENAFYNNLVVFDRQRLSRAVNIGPDTAPETFSFSHNLWYAHDEPAASAPDLPVDETAGLSGQDPHLLDRAGGDYHIAPDSPAAHSGAAFNGRTPADNEGRCYADAPSRGAYAVD